MKEIIEKVIGYNTPEKNILKVVEETTELNEVLIKFLTKKPDARPKVDKIIEEMGDTIFRMKVLATMMGINEQVEQRVNNKAKQLDEYINNQMYKGGV